MKVLINLFTGMALMVFAASCGNNNPTPAPASFCDTAACMQDTLKFTGTHEKKPTLFITAKNCQPDSIIWSYKGMGADRKTGFTYLLGATVRVNKDYIRCHFQNADVAWLLFNDCLTGRGFQIKLPYDKNASFSLKHGAINNLDKKFSISDDLAVSTDRGNLFVEDMNTGKKGMMTFGQKLDIDYDAIHEHIDSVNVTADRVWVKILIGKDWVEKEAKITLE